ncbi:hypothetical protein NE237_021602 [Protea cynaroides]|uniref:Reverse transcriptase Ty1/copia-type domain-containing protein n=1 Tax=Protea cynaroides TaxID=273540 RepID=A0A9Q0HCP4_9MAGN|nr:hypothetical protein NE237_021602 [Protea cynaroides]
MIVASFLYFSLFFHPTYLCFNLLLNLALIGCYSSANIWYQSLGSTKADLVQESDLTKAKTWPTSVKMKTMFLLFGLWDLVENGYEEQESVNDMMLAQQKELNDKKQDDNAALGMIQRGVADSIFPRIMEATKAKEAWEILMQKFQGDVKPTLYVKRQGNVDILIISLYVDDLVFTRNNEKMIQVFKQEMMMNYEISDMGLLHQFLGIEICQDEDGVFISQRKYVVEILKKFGMASCKPIASPLVVNEKLMKEDGAKKVDATSYRSLVRNLLYLTTTRPDIMFAASFLFKFIKNNSHIQLGAAKRVLRYLQDTICYGIKFRKDSKLKFVGYYDSDWGGCIDDMKSTSGYAFLLGSCVFSWASKKQQSVAQSSAKVEYISASLATSQAIWLRRIMKDIGLKQKKSTTIYCDNRLAIAIAKNPVHYGRTRHIAIKHHFIRQAIEKGEVELKFCRSEEQVANFFTKALRRMKFQQFREALEVVEQHIKAENVVN